MPFGRAASIQGKMIDMPPVGHSNVTFKKAKRYVKKGKQMTLIDKDINPRAGKQIIFGR